MRNISSLLERLSKTLNKGTFQKEAVVNVIKDKTRATVPAENIFIKEGVLEITASPAVKSEISLNEDLILGELKESYSIHIARILYK